MERGKRVIDRSRQGRRGDGQPRPAPLLREAVGRVLREERTDRDERLVDVTRQASISPQYLSEIERGAKDPSSEVLRSVSGALGLHPAEVVRRASSVMAGAPRRSHLAAVPRPAPAVHPSAVRAARLPSRSPSSPSTQQVVLLAA